MTTSLSIDEVRKIARLSSLELTDNEAEVFAEQFSTILDYFELLKTIYIREFSWKLYLKIRKLLKKILPSSFYNKIKMIFSKKIVKFQHKRFKY